MKLISYLNRPEYIFRPTQVYQRFLQRTSSQPFERVQLPWGIEIKIRPNEDLGLAIWKMGVYDLCVTELLWRLIDPGETTLDIGANIGYMTSIMAQRVGKTGQVLCFEPHPEIYQELAENIQHWQATSGWNQIQPHSLALSEAAGEGFLETSSYFESNRGTASLAAENPSTSTALQAKKQGYTVQLQKLDALIDSAQKIGVAKIDVEGHEISVLKGASRLLSQSQIRDIIFEDHQAYPSPVTELLENHRYTLFRINKGFLKPVLSQSFNHHPFYSPFWEPPSYLATLDPQRTQQRLQHLGWKSLKTQTV
ncbi:FkbM family methyltransferase [Desertifilum sp. FACHB-1129]|uniref:Methyltransferase FkbM domain-containing protein n=2 Tax=Desertifilum tharense IPPAS B-1220 TaxID=1781255 RepID=A0A1E5QMN5_9CYAN|nr:MULTISPECIES: FkbM family methyltransferase [Desertifilum]MDA0208792.1 FkbM family methyltransferase [Cyanobacteria bacterium FC1]MBD2310994.1 FkbM family methyltransferase [Desertifilum sp. FACHB-1129]MBD2321399.1 FkbM family methyltransferase [Desertifilum sp. FACHB-866]MBD2331294.1 FkbM family methyltransferase [Desertifilum sp. FACHB-868]OEJ75939.1 hypothetical protein BH720_06565 [Desertifilum tharense IPPAS B-1220]